MTPWLKRRLPKRQSKIGRSFSEAQLGYCLSLPTRLRNCPAAAFTLLHHILFHGFFFSQGFAIHLFPSNAVLNVRTGFLDSCVDMPKPFSDEARRQGARHD